MEKNTFILSPQQKEKEGNLQKRIIGEPLGFVNWTEDDLVGRPCRDGIHSRGGTDKKKGMNIINDVHKKRCPRLTRKKKGMGIDHIL